MNKYLLKGLLFSVPLFIYAAIIIVVDPYNFLNFSSVISDEDKFRVIQRTDESSPRGNILWKTLEFKRKPVKNLIIGDSQGRDINTELIGELTGEEYYNFCFPGASFNTMFETFWFAVKYVKPEKVYFQVAFMNYNTHREYDLFHFAQDYFDRPWEYFTTKEIFIDSFMNLVWVITRNPKVINRSYEFLNQQELQHLAQFRLDLFFKKYEYPQNYNREFKKIKAYCEAHGIDLEFIILPVYKAVDEHLRSVGLFDQKLRFKADMQSLGTTYDLDRLSEIKSERSNFIDYFHPQPAIMDSLVTMLWARGGLIGE
ncbi:hypothetical protein TBC1_111619 [Lentimicrobium saccharophilum]|uniref:SGNH/GDSL hydrolase family protein n=1 Tax=Lentimicrobium saccharophilum TaxID=1678841 RepID=A0A0S7BRT7_9BACT|nr:hypothetical protein [Lentimicrobium saccharophilum]GAP43466.1 hypothetical protein TBC1_111619 [Lentimicrobium saccharophilum]